MTKETQQPKGFAGLDDMASDIDIPEPIRRPVQSAPNPAPYSSPPVSSNYQAFEIDESLLNKGKPKGMSSQMKWGIGIGIVVVLAIIGNLNSKDTSGSYSAPANVEAMPPPGVSQVLADNQIRYCLSQDIRMDSWGSVVDHYSQTAIDSFNAAVGDYNSRCSDYKYKRGAIDRVRAEVETRRGSLQSEGTAQASIYR